MALCRHRMNIRKPIGLDARCPGRSSHTTRYHHWTQPSKAHIVGGRCALAGYPLVGAQHRSRFRPKRSTVVALYTTPPQGATTICVDELGPVTPRTFPPSPGWSPDGHRIKAPLEYSRSPEKVWIVDIWSTTRTGWTRDHPDDPFTQHSRLPANAQLHRCKQSRWGVVSDCR